MKNRNKKARKPLDTVHPTFSSTTGFLIRADESLLIIKDPDPSTNINLDDIKQMIGERGLERVARKRGQNGFKMNTNHTFFIKDLKAKERVKCDSVASEIVFVDGVSKLTPAFQPVKVYKK